MEDGWKYILGRLGQDAGFPAGYLLLTDVTHPLFKVTSAPRWVDGVTEAAEFVPGLLYYRSLTDLTNTSSAPGTSDEPTGTQWVFSDGDETSYQLDQPLVEMQAFQQLGRGMLQAGMWNNEGAYHLVFRKGIGHPGRGNWIGLVAFPLTRLGLSWGSLDSTNAKVRETAGVLTGSAFTFANGLTMDSTASECGASLLGYTSAAALYSPPFDALKDQAAAYDDNTIYGVHYGLLGSEAITGGLGAFLITRHWNDTDTTPIQRRVRAATIAATGITIIAGNYQQGGEAVGIPLGGLLLGTGSGALWNLWRANH